MSTCLDPASASMLRPAAAAERDGGPRQLPFEELVRTHHPTPLLESRPAAPIAHESSCCALSPRTKGSALHAGRGLGPDPKRVRFQEARALCDSEASHVLWADRAPWSPGPVLRRTCTKPNVELIHWPKSLSTSSDSSTTIALVHDTLWR